MDDQVKPTQDAVVSTRFSIRMSELLDGFFARLVRRNVRLQESNSVYILDSDMERMRRDGEIGLGAARSYLRLIPTER